VCPPSATPSAAARPIGHPQSRDRRRRRGGAGTAQADLCLDEFTDHGHCGVLAADGSVDNDATLEVYAQMALAQAEPAPTSSACRA
jgi:delta-aminolevulinic acid dehydratase/porphobilinogen synthase